MGLQSQGTPSGLPLAQMSESLVLCTDVKVLAIETDGQSSYTYSIITPSMLPGGDHRVDISPLLEQKRMAQVGSDIPH